MSSTQQIATVPQGGQLQQAFGAFSPAVLVEQVQMIQQAMASVMHDGEHYGVIPGTEKKNKDGKDISKRCLFKPGAEKLGFLFRLAPAYEISTIEMPHDHREYRVVCRLESIQSGSFVGSGVGSCSTMESKYRWRGGARKCPVCGAEAIKRSKYPPRDDQQAEPGWYCFAKVGGCGANFAADDSTITSQSEARSENPDIADTYNTVLKMAKKRAHVDAILTATAASDIFTQDLDDMLPEEQPAAPPRQQAPQQQRPAANGNGTPKPAPPQQRKHSPKIFAERVQHKDNDLAAKGVCQPGELVRHVREAGVLAGSAPELESWSDAAIEASFPVVQQFERVNLEPLATRIRQIHGLLPKRPAPENTWGWALEYVGAISDSSEVFEEPSSPDQAVAAVLPLVTAAMVEQMFGVVAGKAKVPA